ncbi:MAG: choice-of-anchor I family protein [Microcoleaceae cyanobacterium]
MADSIQLTVLGTYETGVFDESAAEIPAYDPESRRAFVVNCDTNAIDVLDLTNPTEPTLVGEISVTDFGAGANSVAVKNGLVAVAVEAEAGTDPGQAVFFDTEGNFLNAITVGVLPDMITFTPDGNKVLTANEAEPVDEPGDENDPEGSISVVDLSNGVENLTVAMAEFTQFNGQEEFLRSQGVRIFPGVSFAQDAEPEYIATNADGSQAFVTLQENNAVAVVDVESATVLGIQPLGLKDFSQGLPELTAFDFEDRGNLTNSEGEDLVSATGETIGLGGFSGLWFDGVADNGNLQFLTVPDRGPTGDDVDGDEPFLVPDLQSQVISFELNEATGEITVTDKLFLTRADGTTPITGLTNIPNVDLRPVDAAGNSVDLPGLTDLDASEFGSDFDPLGADLEGIVRAPNGNLWMVDEYRPAIYNFTAEGELINRFVPQGTLDMANEANPGVDFPEGTFGAETLPEEYLNRRANRGFEGVALDTDENILYAFIQTPMSNPDRETGDDSSIIRMIGVDPATGVPVAEYVYLLQDPEIGNNVDKIGDAVYAGEGKFFTIERDSSIDVDSQKFVFEIDLTGATNVLGMDFGDETLEQQTADGLAEMGISPVNKVKVTNLPSLGYIPSDKPEGIAIVDDRLAVLNDNDFGLIPETAAVELGFIDFSGSNGLDASDEDGEINIQNWPVFGMFMPDSIGAFEVNGQTFYAIANEGDDRGEDERIEDLILDPTAFPNAEELQQEENLGRLGVSTIDGDIDGDGDFDQLFSYGARSFSIYDANGNQVFDSGDDFEQITAAVFPEDFNSSNDENDDFDSRSDNKGPEPEGIEIGEVDGNIFAFIGLERIGGVMVYDVTDPASAEFVQYLNNRDFFGDAEAGTAGDLGPEGLEFVGAEASPTGRPLLVVGNEVSGTTTVYDFGMGAIEGGSDGDVLVGDDANDLILANDGNDTVAGGLGDDAIFGGAGRDLLRGDADDRSSDEEGGNDRIFGGEGNDRIGGKAGDDELFGDEGNDRIWGDQGADTLRGGLGNDTLNGDSGDIFGGADVFVLAAGEGTDTITDFEMGLDLIGLAEGLTFGELSLSGSEIGFGSEILAILEGVSAEDLGADDFMMV